MMSELKSKLCWTIVIVLTTAWLRGTSEHFPEHFEQLLFPQLGWKGTSDHRKRQELARLLRKSFVLYLCLFWFLSLSKSVFRIEREKEETLVEVSK